MTLPNLVIWTSVFPFYGSGGGIFHFIQMSTDGEDADQKPRFVASDAFVLSHRKDVRLK